MFDAPLIDESLLAQLPLPLAQVFRRALNAKTPLEQHLSALYLAEVGLKLLASAAVVEYAAIERPTAELEDCLKNLARPSLGQWWEIGRRLTPVLADSEAPGYEPLRQLLLGRSRDDMPRAAGLDAVLREMLGVGKGARSTVRLSELFDRLVTLRNKGPGHGAPAAHPEQFHARIGAALLSGLAEVYGRMDVLAGKQLVYVSEVRQSAGVWQVQLLELAGANARRLPSLELTRDELTLLPDGERVYLRRSTEAKSPLLPLYPLILYEPDSEEVLLLNGRQGRQQAEWLCYTSGRELRDQAELHSQHHALLARLLRIEVSPRQIDAWAEKSQADDPQSEPAPQSQRTLGEFELLSVLGRGGMGVVYRAWQPSLGRQVALKKLLRSGDKSEQRFAREIRALGRVDHPNLVKIYADGSEADQWFYAMELIEGAPLASVCERLQFGAASAADVTPDTWHQTLTTTCEEARHSEQPLAGKPFTTDSEAAVPPDFVALPPIKVESYVRHVVELVRQVATATQKLHDAGVIHRDIKPGNIMLTADGSQAVLMDLGLAQWVNKEKMTQTRQFVGTLRYASPEQVLAVDRLDGRSDVYSLGATLWELLTLRPMFGATDETPTPNLMKTIQYEDAEPIGKHHPGIAPDLEAIVVKCLEKNPASRYATATDLAEDLARWLRNEPVHARAANWRYRLGKFARRNRRRIEIGLIVLGVQAVLVAALFRVLRPLTPDAASNAAAKTVAAEGGLASTNVAQPTPNPKPRLPPGYVAPRGDDVAPDIDDNTASLPAGGESYALLFATQSYDAAPDGKKWPALDSPKIDATAVGNLLHDRYGFITNTYLDQSKLDISKDLRQWHDPKKYGRDSELLVFFSGHGYFDWNENRGYIVAKDSLSYAAAPDARNNSCVSLDDLAQQLNKVPCRHIFLILDACFGGTIDNRVSMPKTRGAPDVVTDIGRAEYIAAKMAKKCRLYLASAGRETALDGVAGKHSPFVQSLLDCLSAKESSHGVLTAAMLHDSISRLKDERPGFGTLPGDEGGDFLFIPK